MGVLDYVKWSPKLTKLIYNILYSRIAYRESKANASDMKKLSALRNVHKGERCFIIGTGPSLRVEDLETLKNEYTFAPNRIFELFNNTDWRPTYYICQDSTIIQNFSEKIKMLSTEFSFLPVNYKTEFKGDHYRFFVLKEQLYYPNNAPFSKDVSKCLGQGYTVTYGAIQMAIYMGFSEIYLLGIDHNYNIIRDAKGRPVKKDVDSNYAKGMTNFMQNLPRVEESTIAYETAEKISKKMGIKIYNATRGGKLEAFERIDFDKIMKK